MGRFRTGMLAVGLVVGMLALPAAPAAAGWSPEWGPLPTEGPTWWAECGLTGSSTPQAWCEELVLPGFFVTNAQATEITTNSATLNAYVKPIAGQPTTYWELSVSTEPLCRQTWSPGREEFWVCDEQHPVHPTRIASGEIAGGNPEELRPTVTIGST